MKKVLRMTFDKATKGSIRYAETVEADDQIIRTVYVRKSAFGEVAPEGMLPKEITVTVEWELPSGGSSGGGKQE